MLKALVAPPNNEQQQASDGRHDPQDTKTHKNIELWESEESEDVELLPVLLLSVAVTALLALIYSTGPHAPTVRTASVIVLSASVFAGAVYYFWCRCRK